MFYIRDIDSKKYIRITKENGKLKFSLTSSQMMAYKFKDNQIKLIYKKVISLFPDKVFLADYIAEEKKNSFNKSNIFFMLSFIYSLIITIFFGFLYLHNAQKIEKDTIELKNDFSILKNDYMNKLSIIENTNIKTTLENIKLDTNAAIDYFNSKSIYNFALKASIKYDIPLYIIYAIIDTESEGLEKAKSNAGCIGLTQISRDAVKEYNKTYSTEYEFSDAWSIDLNIEIGIWYYRWCVNQVLNTKLLDDDIYNSAYIMYNIGYGNYVNSKNTADIIKSKKVYIGNTLYSYKSLSRFETKRGICEDVFIFKDLYSD